MYPSIRSAIIRYFWRSHLFLKNTVVSISFEHSFEVLWRLCPHLLIRVLRVIQHFLMGFSCQKILFCRSTHYLRLPIFDQVFVIEDRLLLCEGVLEFGIWVFIGILGIAKRDIRIWVAKTIAIHAVGPSSRLIIIDSRYQIITTLMLLIFQSFGCRSLRSWFLLSWLKVGLGEDSSRILTS